MASAQGEGRRTFGGHRDPGVVFTRCHRVLAQHLLLEVELSGGQTKLLSCRVSRLVGR